jgi:Cu2+-exporting ATPase
MREFHAIAGQGVEGVVGAHRVAIGGPALLRRAGVTLPPQLDAASSAPPRGQASITTSRPRRGGRLAIADAIREESREAVRRHDQGLEVIMMTGDAAVVANAVAIDVGIETVFAEVLPEEKASKVETLKDRGKRSQWSATRERCTRASRPM